MADRRLMAAFYLSLERRPSDGEERQWAERAGVEITRTRPWGPDGTEVGLGRWGGLACETRLLGLSYYDVLVISLRRDDLHAVWTEEEQRGELPPGARQVMMAFIDACQAVPVVSALLTSYAWIDPDRYLAELEDRVISGDVINLAREHLWLMFVQAADVSVLSAHLPDNSSRLLPIPGGAVLARSVDSPNG